MQGERSESILQNFWDKLRRHAVICLAEGRLCNLRGPFLPSFPVPFPPSFLDLRFVNVDLCHSLVYLIPYCLFGIERQTERDAALELGIGTKVRYVLHSWPSFGSELRICIALSRNFFEIELLSLQTTAAVGGRQRFHFRRQTKYSILSSRLGWSLLSELPC